MSSEVPGQEQSNIGVPFLVDQQMRPTQEAIMRKLAIALVAAITVVAAVPAVAQVGFYSVPGGISVNVGPGYFVYGQYYAWPYHRRFYQWRRESYARSW